MRRAVSAFDLRVLVRRLPVGVAVGTTVFALVWVLFWAPHTNFGSAVHSPSSFLTTLLNP